MNVEQHLDELTLSSYLDRQLPLPALRAAEGHLASCLECGRRLEETRTVADLLARLPDVEPPRDFVVGPRRLEQVQRVATLRQWYGASRVAASALSAVFVLLLGAQVYLQALITPATSRQATAPEAQTAATSAQPSADSRAVLRPAPTSAPAAPAAAPRAAAPLARPQNESSGAAAPGASGASAPSVEHGTSPSAGSPEPGAPSVQGKATVETRPLVTAPADSGTALDLRMATSVVGLIAVLAAVLAVSIRHRLKRAQSPESH